MSATCLVPRTYPGVKSGQMTWRLQLAQLEGELRSASCRACPTACSFRLVHESMRVNVACWLMQCSPLSSMILTGHTAHGPGLVPSGFIFTLEATGSPKNPFSLRCPAKTPVFHVPRGLLAIEGPSKLCHPSQLVPRARRPPQPRSLAKGLQSGGMYCRLLQPFCSSFQSWWVSRKEFLSFSRKDPLAASHNRVH